jgi:hypothetical protein
MDKKLGVDRRKFIQGSAGLLGATSFAGWKGATEPAEAKSTNLKMQAMFESKQSVWVLIEPGGGFQERLASRELARGLRSLGLVREPKQAETGGVEAAASDCVFALVVNKQAFKHPEAYEIVQTTEGGKAPRTRITGATPQAILYAVFDFLERQGAFFGLDGEVYPLEPAKTLSIPPPGQPWTAQPRFKVRGLNPWPNFLNSMAVFNREDFRAYLEAMLRMRFNTLGMHVFSQSMPSGSLGTAPYDDSYLSFEYCNVGHLASTDTTTTTRWGYLAQRTSRFGMGAADLYDGEVFGSEATTRARNCWEAAEFAQQLWGEAFRYAQQLGIRVGLGFEPYEIPDEIFSAAPPEARYASKDPKVPGPRLDPDSVTARDILEARLGRLLEAYPTVDYVWLWEPEGMNWASQNANVPFSTTPFKQAHDFLRRHAPQKRLVLSGWGGVVRHFAYFHQELPGDVIFSSLNDNLGWDPVHEVYSRLEGRERWAIPWLEDDPSMWLPQFHVYRNREYMDLAEQYGCEGILGLHWRHRIMDADAGLHSRYSWDKTLQPEGFFKAFAAAQVRAPRAINLAKVLDETDRDRLILCSFTGEIKNSHHQINEYSGDYGEAFQFWNGYEPPAEVVKSQAKVAAALRELTESASSPAERERLNYLARFVEFLVPYSASWSLAFHLHQVLQQAGELRKQGKPDEARRKVAAEGVPLWLKLAPLVREALLDFQEIVSTRNDIGVLASLHNKYERLALFRLRMSMKEFLGELPPETEKLLAEVQSPDPNAARRVFIPTRPTLLRAGERVRVFAVAPGRGEVLRVSLYVRAGGSGKWNPIPMTLVGRRTYSGELVNEESTASLLHYYAEAEFRLGGTRSVATAPVEAPARFYTVTLV